MLKIAFAGLSAFVVDLIETLVIGFSIFAIVYMLLMQPHQVSGHSMDPNLQTADYLLTDKISYRFRSPQRGEIVVFHAPEGANCVQGTGCDYIKRVIGLPGETVEVKGESIYINGNLLKEDYLPAGTPTYPGAFTKDRAITLGPKEYFLVGDNRTQSSDSRAWGPVPPELIVGRAFFRYWPITSAEFLPSVSY
jgi:signal peptidase I